MGLKLILAMQVVPTLLKAGIEDAKVLVVAIDNPELTLRIVEFAREVNPNIKLVVRSYD